MKPTWVSLAKYSCLLHINEESGNPENEKPCLAFCLFVVVFSPTTGPVLKAVLSALYYDKMSSLRLKC